MACSVIVSVFVPYLGNTQPRIAKSPELGHGFNQPRFGVRGGVDQHSPVSCSEPVLGLTLLQRTMVKREDGKHEPIIQTFILLTSIVSRLPTLDRTNATALTITLMEVTCRTHVRLEEMAYFSM